MRLCLLITLLAGLVMFSATLQAQARITSVEPLTAKAGDTVNAIGEEIDNANVDTLYLTDGTNDFKCQMVEQTATTIKFKVPDNMKAGRWALMVHTKKNQLIEQPVKLAVE
jgi:hypothetical protein